MLALARFFRSLTFILLPPIFPQRVEAEPNEQPGLKRVGATSAGIVGRPMFIVLESVRDKFIGQEAVRATCSVLVVDPVMFIDRAIDRST